MALFSKKPTLDEIMKSIGSLTDEEQKSLRAKLADLDKAEDEREIDKIEEEKAGDSSEEDEKKEEVNEESEEIGKDVDEIEEEAAEDGDEKAEEADSDKYDALRGELAELRKQHEALQARFDAYAENKSDDDKDDEDDKSFGISSRNESGSDKGQSELEKARAKYFNF